MGNTEDEVRQRIENLPSANLNNNIISELQNMLHYHKTKINNFKFTKEHINENYKVVISEENKPRGEHERRFNEPTNNDVAVLLLGEECLHRDIIIEHCQEGIKIINELHRAYDPFQCPLIFWK